MRSYMHVSYTQEQNAPHPNIQPSKQRRQIERPHPEHNTQYIQLPRHKNCRMYDTSYIKDSPWPQSSFKY